MAMREELWQEFEYPLDISRCARSATTEFTPFALEWLAQMSIYWKRSHRLTVEGIVGKYLLPVFGHFELCEVNRRAILNFRAWLARQPGRSHGATLSAQRINHIMTVLRMILDEAAKQLNIANPARALRRLKVDKPDIHPFTCREIRQILNAVRPEFRNYYQVRFFTGMRTGEIDGLKWRFVDFERNQIMVRETIVRGRVETPKTRNSYRDIDMSRF